MEDAAAENSDEQERLLISDRFEKIQDARRALHPNLYSAASDLLKKQPARLAIAKRILTNQSNSPQKKMKTLRLNKGRTGKIFK